MRFIPTLMHGVLDYLIGILLIISPWMFGFQDDSAQTIVPIVLGVAALVYSMFTNYELGLIKRIPMKAHLTMDLLSGIVLAASPWLFGFSDTVYLPHLVLGIFEIVAALTTATKPSTLNKDIRYKQHAH